MKKEFDLPHVLHELKHFLPSQTPLKDFIHHNSLHAFQSQKFFDAIFQASETFGFQVTFQLNEYRKLFQNGRIRPNILDKVIRDEFGSENVESWKQKLLHQKYDTNYHPRIGRLRKWWKQKYHLDMDTLVQPRLFRIICSYLDQGIALWHFPFEDKGLLYALRAFEKKSYISFFNNKEVKLLLLDENLTIASLLSKIVGEERYFENYIMDQQFSHRGWSGMVGVVEDQPHSLLYQKKVTLEEFIVLELLLELDALYDTLGHQWRPLAENLDQEPVDFHAAVQKNEHQMVLTLWQKAFEWDYYDEVMAGIKKLKNVPSTETTSKKSFQAVFCIDEREDSLRRHIENVDPKCETLGCPGFFGVEFYFQPFNGKFYEKLCPAPVTPKYLIKELNVTDKRKHEIIYTKSSHTLLRGFLASISLGLLASVKLLMNLWKPKMTPAISNAFAHMNLNSDLTIEHSNGDQFENGLQIGFTVGEMAQRVEGLLRGMGMIKDFTSLVYIVGHGSSSANNPHHGAHDCGACSGRPGSVNARVFAFMANHQGVRKILTERGLVIPNGTWFVGGLHDTAADEIAFYDEDIIPDFLQKEHEENLEKFESALDLNARERSRRFASIDISRDIKKVRKAIKERSVSFFEPRPELGHGTNALCFVGSRKLTKGLFLDRRAFMNSYDHSTDPDGALLLGVIRPLPPVCGGINLEYYFSRIDNYKLGAGTKLPHNVMGLIGVSNSSDGDLRPGLPLQMIEVHDPVRLLIMVEHRPEVVLKTISAEPALYEWFQNEWVHLVVIHPDDETFHYFRNGHFEPYEPEAEIPHAPSDQHLIKAAKEMKTNYIIDATKENIPVHILNESDHE